MKKPLRSPIRKRATRRPGGSTRSTRARRTTREAGIRQRSIVGRRLALEDAEIITKYTFPFVDAEWRVTFTVVDRIGGPPRVLEGAIRFDGDRLHAPSRVADLRPVESIPADRFAELAHFDPWWAFRGVSGVDRRWVETIFSTNIARTFVQEHRTLKVHDLRFSDDLRTLEVLLTKDDAFRTVEFHAREIDLRSRRRAPHRCREAEALGSTKAL
ncbi:MAG TPA: hypothetical protein VEO96_04235 [Thermoplasmata archaeon]|nr:hypothetical protein [Thermoplasmata archaeon]